MAGWQKVLGIIGLLVALALGILLLGGGHGPGLHTPEDPAQRDEAPAQPSDLDGDGDAPPGHTPPDWAH